ncbi:MAG TPA: AAA family ATPase, partial [Chitinophagales bacterium]|nr:AAA family ATPase [Chitinophagales bacterium]
MLISFSVQNFGAFKEMQTLSFEAANSQHLEEYYIIQPQKGLRLLKLMLLYGANASGKSTLLKAIDFLRNVVINPLPQKSDKIAYYPFLFDTETPQQDSLFIVECIPQKIKYRYELRLNQQAIIEEKLYVYNPKKAVLFHRTTNTVQQLAQISFGEKAKITKQT